jgi:hypothetical protein
VQDKRFDKAVQSMQTGLAMARHVADSPILIQALVGTAIANLMLQPAEEWIGSPDSPNLYWALAVLPQPFIVTAPARQGETAGLTVRSRICARNDGDLTASSGTSCCGPSSRHYRFRQPRRVTMEVSMAQACWPIPGQAVLPVAAALEQVEAMPGQAILLYVPCCSPDG